MNVEPLETMELFIEDIDSLHSLLKISKILRERVKSDEMRGISTEKTLKHLDEVEIKILQLHESLMAELMSSLSHHKKIRVEIHNNLASYMVVD